MQIIKNINALEILDSRGNPTLEVTCELQNGALGVFSVPSGASTGINEVVELRDNDPLRYGGKGVLKAIQNTQKEIKDTIIGKKFNQKSLDDTLIALDGTTNKSRLGGNAILGVSMAFAKAEAIAKGKELFEHIAELAENNSDLKKMPTLMLNVINGGKHADSGLDIQEYMLVPDFPTVKENIQAGAEIISFLKKDLHAKNLSVGVGDEGGFAPKLSSNEEALSLLQSAIKESSYTGKVNMALDVASSSFFKNEKYELEKDNKSLDKDALIEMYASWVEKYPIISIEDGIEETDWDGFKKMFEKLGGKIKITGDDLTVTSPQKIQKGGDEKAINAVIIKPNQIGTLSETLEAIKIAKENNIAVIVSHRSGETTDTFIADLAVGVSADFLKSGSLVRGERVCKYNRLLQIEKKLQK
ncbi:MAG: phosphopyruvate hydratase [Candidatus Pacebacteria bacterium]|nr:phosphopyruvate hydratase [Candidatus Paceibacterota bacterium]MCF7862702.1 phosphopyruvate hydratase [Candidatus Paceibacterota bacterium]